MHQKTLRLPEHLAIQIEDRARIMRRSFNSEVISLLEKAISDAVNTDRQLMEKMLKIQTGL